MHNIKRQLAAAGKWGLVAAATLLVLILSSPQAVNADELIQDEFGRYMYICDEGLIHYKGKWSTKPGGTWYSDGNNDIGVYLENSATQDILYIKLPEQQDTASTEKSAAIEKVNAYPGQRIIKPASISLNGNKVFYISALSDEAAATEADASSNEPVQATTPSTTAAPTAPTSKAPTAATQAPAPATQAPRQTAAPTAAPATQAPPPPTTQAPPPPTTQAPPPPTTQAPPPPTTQAASGSFNRASAEELVRLINEYRVANGVGALSLSENLMSVAAKRAVEISTDFSHAGISKYGNYGENIFMGAGDSKYNYASTALAAFKASPSHNTNQLYASYRSIGVGHYITANGFHYWAVVFSF